MEGLLDFDLGLDLDLSAERIEEKQKEAEADLKHQETAREIHEDGEEAKVDEKQINQVRSLQVFKTMSTSKKLKILSEKALEEKLPWHFETGAAYHCISFGDVDSLTYLRSIVKQTPLKYCLISTWCMAPEDAREIKSWIKKGYIEKMDFYVGEIFEGGYRGAFETLCDAANLCGGRVAVFRNHSKVMACVGKNGEFYTIESSANVNTNPRTEQTTITVDQGLTEFYIDFYNGIRSFNHRFDDWKPAYEVEDKTWQDQG